MTPVAPVCQVLENSPRHTAPLKMGEFLSCHGVSTLDLSNRFVTLGVWSSMEKITIWHCHRT